MSLSNFLKESIIDDAESLLLLLLQFDPPQSNPFLDSIMYKTRTQNKMSRQEVFGGGDEDDTTTTAIETTKLYSLHRIKLFKLFASFNTLFTAIVIIYMIIVGI